MNRARYDDVRDALRSGDVLLFSGRGPVSAGIRLGTRSTWSHVGMVYRPGGDVGPVLVWESTTLGKVVDADLARVVAGVTLVPMRERVATYPGTVAVRRLVWRRPRDLDARLEAVRRDLHGRPYERDLSTLVLAAYDGPGGDAPHDLASLFCSELVGETFRRLGLLPSEVEPAELVPADFSTERRSVDGLLVGDAVLDVEQVLDPPSLAAA